MRERSRKVLAIPDDRQKVLRDARQALELKGNVSHGGELFRQHCAACHRLRNEGIQLGPDLGTVADRSAEELLRAILDPNLAVDVTYVSYLAITTTGREVYGTIASETANSISLRLAGGLEETLLRRDLKELRSSGLSLMPEGFEKLLSAQDLADLIQFVTSPGAN